MQRHIYQSEDLMMATISDPPTLKKPATRLWQKEELPNEFKWMELLSPLHYRLCLVDLHAAVSQACITNDWDRVEELSEDWKATAEMDANPGLAKHILSTSLEYEDLDTSDLGS